MSDPMYPRMTRAHGERRHDLAPRQDDAFTAFSRAVFEPGALDARTKQLIAVAVGHATQCPYCIRAHTKLAARQGASEAEIMEAIWVAVEMKAGAAFAHATLALDTLDDGKPNG